MLHIAALDDSARWVAICADSRDAGPVNLSLQLWDTHTMQRIAAPLANDRWQAWSLVVNDDRSPLAVGTFSGPILLFNVLRNADGVTLEPTAELVGHTGMVNSLAFHPSEHRLVSSARDQTPKVWDLETRTEVATLHGATNCANCLVFDPQGDRLVSGSVGIMGTDNVARLWGTERLSAADAAARVAAMRAYNEARRHLRGQEWNHETCAEAVRQVAEDPTLPADVRQFATDELLTRLISRQVHDEER